MNIAKQAAGSALRFRAYATAAYVPPASMDGLQRARPPPPKPKPESPTFYTARANYYDNLDMLENAVKHTRSALQTLQLLPLPRFAQENLPPIRSAWKNLEDLGEKIQAKLTTTRYRRVLAHLNQLNQYRRLAEMAGHMELAQRLKRVLELYERENKDKVLASAQPVSAKFDEYGRSYTIGRRKESTARVWVIKVQPSPEEQAAATEALAAPTESEAAAPAPEPTPQDSVVASAPATGIPGFESGPLSVGPVQLKVPTTSILINNIPLVDYL